MWGICWLPEFAISFHSGVGIESRWICLQSDQLLIITVVDSFLLDSSGIQLIRYFGSSREVVIIASVEILAPDSFTSRICPISLLTFENGSRLHQIDCGAFDDKSFIKSSSSFNHISFSELGRPHVIVQPINLEVRVTDWRNIRNPLGVSEVVQRTVYSEGGQGFGRAWLFGGWL
jgi:hypothetical protein